MMNMPPPIVSIYSGAKPSQSFSPVPASTNATSSSDVFRRSARNSEIFCSALTFPKLSGIAATNLQIPERAFELGRPILL